MALNVIKFLTETIQAMAMAKNIALLAAAHRPYVALPSPHHQIQKQMTHGLTPQLFFPLFLISGPDVTRSGV